MDESDRRAHPRHDISLKVVWADGGTEEIGFTENVSEGGLLVQTDRMAAPGERLRLELSFPDLLAPVEVDAEVVRCRPSTPGAPAAMAVRVRDDDPRSRAVLGRIASSVDSGKAPRPERTPYHLLLVDDDRLCLEIWQDMVREAEAILPGGRRIFEVAVAVRAQQALEIVAKTPIDLLVTDVEMPGMSGAELVSKVRRSSPKTRIAIVSSLADTLGSLALGRFGADICLSKPIRVEELVKTVRTLLSLD
ncbi:MAG: response regulator [Deltaproteobacteria bacterium]